MNTGQDGRPIRRVLIANRGEIARRVIRTCQRLGIQTVAVYSSADAQTPHVQEADLAIEIGPPPAAESYLDTERVLAAAVDSGADAIHPGYGFLSENPEFARRTEARGLTWIGPSADTMLLVADKGQARIEMDRVGVPVSRGCVVQADPDPELIAEEVGLPLIVKACAGGGGIGMQVVTELGSIAEAVDRVRTFGERFFGNPGVLVERYLPSAKHIEVQVLGYHDGTVAILGERECSVQRRYQKVIEEAPSPRLDAGVRKMLYESAQRGAEAIGYQGAGTFEFLVSGRDVAFLEVNARIQVEHPVTELTTGIDIVEQQLHVASRGSVGRRLNVSAEVFPHALELRLYAEDPNTFFPSPGVLERFRVPNWEGVRLEAAYSEGNVVSQYYDPLLAKICVSGASREEAIQTALEVIDATEVKGLKTNLPFLRQVLMHESFVAGNYDVGIVSQMKNST